MTEKRKQGEIAFANKRAREKSEVTKKIYAIAGQSRNFLYSFILKNAKNRKKARILDYGCGNGFLSLKLAEELIKQNCKIAGIDISEKNINTCIGKAKKSKLKNVEFFVMDCEKTKFKNNHFDIILCSSILHHLNIEKALKELKRILKPSGKIICLEPVSYNPIIQMYRKLTPHLRTKWEKEHILTLKEICEAEKYFNIEKIKYFHLFTLLAIPFANTKLFKPLLIFFERIDDKMLKLPLINKFAWQLFFVLESKNAK